MRISRSTRAIVMMASLALVVTGCSATSNDGSDATGSPEEPVTITLRAEANILSAPLFVGITEGIFLKHGIDLKLETLSSASDVVTAVASGQVQVGTGTFSGLAPAVTAGLDVQAFYPVLGSPFIDNYDNHAAIIVAPGSGIKTVDDLRGKTIAVSFGGGIETYLKAVLAANDIPLSEVTLENVSHANGASAMESGVDAVATTEPYGSLVLDKIPGSEALVRGGGYGDFRIMMLARRSWIVSNPELLQKLTEAAAEASQFTRDFPEEAGKAAASFLPDISPEVIAASMEALDFDPRISPLVEASLLRTLDLLVKQGKIDFAPPLGDILNLELMESLETRAPDYFTDVEPIE